MVEYPAVTIVIPNYNGKQLLQKILPDVCLAAQHYPGKTNIIVVDDGSSEKGTQELVQSFQSIDFFQHPKNRGFSEAVLTGFKSSTTEFIFLLNSDVSPALDSIKPLVARLQDDKVFAVSPLIYNEGGSLSTYSWNRYRWKGLDLRRKKWSLEDIKKAHQTGPIKQLFCSGGSVMMKKSRFLLLGGFASLYKPYYSEDLDLCVRAWRRGWQSLMEPNSSVIHQEIGSINANEKSTKVKTTQRRNSFYFEWSHFPISRLLFFRSLCLLRQLVGRTLTGDKIFLRGLLQALGGLKLVVRHRKEIIASSELSLEEVIILIEN